MAFRNPVGLAITYTAGGNAKSRIKFTVASTFCHGLTPAGADQNLKTGGSRVSKVLAPRQAPRIGRCLTVQGGQYLSAGAPRVEWTRPDAVSRTQPCRVDLRGGRDLLIDHPFSLGARTPVGIRPVLRPVPVAQHYGCNNRCP